MSDSTKQIQDWQEKVKSSFGDESKLLHYLFETLDNFYYRYLETSTDKNLKTSQLSHQVWGAMSVERSMVDALKITNPEAKTGLIEMAKTTAKIDAKVQYTLKVEVQELKPDHGQLYVISEIFWGTGRVSKKVVFKYEDLAQFRKELALKLEEACSLFL